ncbi:MAG: pyridoxamine 5'-phosphate oxidase family protein [Acidimicrobiia bacterium]
MSEKTRLHRHPELGSSDRSVIDEILDNGFVCHVAYLAGTRPVVIPTLYVRDGDRILVHGSPASGIMRAVKRGSPLSIGVTHVDGVVVARSGFQSSINYRSVVIHGIGRALDGPEHRSALDLIVEGLIPGRLADVRAPTPKELRKTSVIAVSLADASAKISDGPPEDETEDLGSGVWAGVVPVTIAYGSPVAAPDLEPGLETPGYLTRFRGS